MSQSTVKISMLEQFCTGCAHRVPVGSDLRESLCTSFGMPGQPAMPIKCSFAVTERCFGKKFEETKNV